MDCQLCGQEPARHQRFIVWTQFVWLILAARAERKYYDCPCCDKCAQQGKRVTLNRTLLVGAFMFLTVVCSFVALFVFSRFENAFLGGGLAVISFAGLLLGTYRMMTRIVHPQTARLLTNPTTAAYFRGRRGRSKPWTVFNAITVAEQVPKNIRVHEIHTVDRNPKPQPDDCQAASS